MKNYINNHSGRRSQRGLTLISLVLVMVILGVVGLIAMRSVPAWSENSAIKKAVAQIESSGINDQAEARRKFDERATLEYITAITGRDLKVTKSSSGVKIDYEYEKRIPLVANAFLVFDFSNNN